MAGDVAVGTIWNSGFSLRSVKTEQWANEFSVAKVYFKVLL